MPLDRWLHVRYAGLGRPRPEAGLVYHSDRGSQYASKVFRRRLWRYRMRQSMSRKGNCWDSDYMAVCYETAA